MGQLMINIVLIILDAHFREMYKAIEEDGVDLMVQ